MLVGAVDVGSATADGSGSDRDTERGVVTALVNHHPRNVIFFLDGMGTQEITAARHYQGVHNKQCRERARAQPPDGPRSAG